MKTFTLLMLVVLTVLTTTKAQTLVSTDVELKNAVLEEYTGIHCGYCPDGHAIAQNIADENPGRVALINIHQGGFATPGAGEPDYRTPFGDALAQQAGVSAYPNGTVNRHVFQGSSTSMGRSLWSSSTNEILLEDSPVNVGVETIYNSENRELTINVELYYTSDSPESTNLLNIALVQNHIFGPQSGGGAGNNYEHMHMLRHLITGQWGEEISNTTSGTFVQETFTYTVPSSYNDVDCIVEDCDITVFVTETHQEIYSSVVVPAIDGTTLITGNLSTPENLILLGEPSMQSGFTMDFTNNLTETEDFEFTFSNDVAPDDWTSSYTINGNTFTDTSIISMESNMPTELSLDIVPGMASGFIKYTISIQSVSHPNASPIIQEVYVVSKVADLLLHNQGSWNGGMPSDFEEDYFTAFDYAGMTDYASCSYRAFILAANEDIINSFTNIFFNIGWTFPGLTDENVGFLTSFIDNGGNLFIAGQDLGWDTWDSNGNGTAITKSFYTNYLNSDYKSDGGTSNNSINANVNDEIFGNLGSSSIVDIYGGNMYPDEIDPVGNGLTILYYNGGTSKSCGVRSIMGESRIVYLGFDPSMVNDNSVRNDLIATSYDWFMQGVGINEVSAFDVNLFPNPLTSQLNISFSVINNEEILIDIYNVLGSKVYNKMFYTTHSGQQTISTNLSGLKNGVYLVVVKNGDMIYKKQVIISR